MQIKTDQLSQSILFATYPIVPGYQRFYDSTFADKVFGTGQQSPNSRGGKREKLISDDLLKALEEQTLDSDYKLLIQIYNAIETLSLHGADPTQLLGLLTEFRVRLNSAKKAYNQHKKAVESNVTNKSLSSIAMTPQGTVFVLDDDGNLINVTVDDYIEQYNDRPMFTNEDLLVLRDKHGQFAFNDDPITIAAHGISESSVRDRIRTYVQDLKTGEATIEGYSLGSGELPGTKEIVDVITKSSRNFSEEGRSMVIAATWEMLTDLEQNYMRALAALQGLSGTGVLSLFDDFVVASVQSNSVYKENKSFVRPRREAGVRKPSSGSGAESQKGAWHTEGYNLGNNRKGESDVSQWAIPIGESDGKTKQSELNNDKYVNLQLSARTHHNLLLKDDLPMVPGYRSVNSFTTTAAGAAAFVTNSVSVGGIPARDLQLDNNAVLIDPSQMLTVRMYSNSRNGVTSPNKQIYIDLQSEIINPLGKVLLELAQDEPGDNDVEKFNSLMAKIVDRNGNVTASGQKFLTEIHNGNYKFIDAFAQIHKNHGYSPKNPALFTAYALEYLAGVRLLPNGQFTQYADYSEPAMFGFNDFTDQFGVFRAAVRVPKGADKIDKKLKLNDAAFKYMPNGPEFIYRDNNSLESKTITEGFNKFYETTAHIAMTNTSAGMLALDKYVETYARNPQINANSYSPFSNAALSVQFNPDDSF